MRKFICALLLSFFLLGCATFNPTKEIFREKADINSRTYNVSSDACFDVLEEVILKKTFSLTYEDKKTGRIQARRFFQKGKRSIVVILSAYIQPLKKNKTAVYLNAIQSTEKLYTKSHTRFFMGLIPLPGGGGETAERLKEGEKTIEDKEFYRNLFEEIEEGLKSSANQNKDKNKTQEKKNP